MDMVLHLILFLSGFVTFFQKKYGIQLSIVIVIKIQHSPGPHLMLFLGLGKIRIK